MAGESGISDVRSSGSYSSPSSSTSWTYAVYTLVRIGPESGGRYSLAREWPTRMEWGPPARPAAT
jgi:hypothetical protein